MTSAICCANGARWPASRLRDKKNKLWYVGRLCGVCFFGPASAAALVAWKCVATAEHERPRYMHHRNTLTGATAEVDNKQISRHGDAAKRLAYEKQAVILRLREGWIARAKAQKENREWAMPGAIAKTVTNVGCGRLAQFFALLVWRIPLYRDCGEGKFFY